MVFMAGPVTETIPITLSAQIAKVIGHPPKGEYASCVIIACCWMGRNSSKSVR